MKCVQPITINYINYFRISLKDWMDNAIYFYSNDKEKLRTWFIALKPYSIQSNYEKIYNE